MGHGRLFLPWMWVIWVRGLPGLRIETGGTRSFGVGKNWEADICCTFVLPDRLITSLRRVESGGVPLDDGWAEAADGVA